MQAHPSAREDSARLKPRGSSQGGLRQYNERVVLQALRLHGALPAAELARLTGLTAQTISLITKHLLDEGLLRKGEPQRGKVGQPSVPLSLDPDGAFSVGIKIGRRSLDVLLVDFSGAPRERWSLDYPFPEPQQVLAEIGARLKDVDTRLGPSKRRRLQGVGIAAPLSMGGWQTLLGVDPALAARRYRAALEKFGFEEILFVYEPVAAAFHFARALKKSATVLVADFGGGTTDFSILRFDVGGQGFSATPLAHGGVGIAGDRFDFHIIDRLVLPHLGKGGKYQGMGKALDLPVGVFMSFARWNMLSVLKSSDEFRDLKNMLKVCLEPEKIERMIELVEEDQGYPLYKAVSEAKMRLSKTEETEFAFAPLGADFRVRIKRADFESWISGDLARIEAALAQTLASAGLTEKRIDRVFLTGGTSFVPAVREIFDRRFGAKKIESGDELLSIASGLALIGERDDAAVWATGD